MNHKKVLGRGLGALIPQRPEAPEAHATPGLAEIPISQIQPNFPSSIITGKPPTGVTSAGIPALIASQGLCPHVSHVEGAT